MADLLGVNETALDAGDPTMPIAFLKQGEQSAQLAFSLVLDKEEVALAVGESHCLPPIL